MKKPRGTANRALLPTSDLADRLLKRLIKAGVVDHAYVARLENRPPRAALRHPEETTCVSVHEMYTSDQRSGTSASRLAKLHKVLQAFDIELKSTGITPLAPARPGTTRVFRAETDRRHRNGGVFAGSKANPAIKGGYFTSGLATAQQYAEPRVAPQGAPLRYVDLPDAVAAAASTERPEVIETLRSRSQRMPARRTTGALRNHEFHLDREWSGRAVAVPAVVEEQLMDTGDAALDARNWRVGREVLDIVSSPLKMEVTLQYVAGDGLKPARTSVPETWMPAEAGIRHYANAQLTIELSEQRVLFIRIGERVDLVAALTSLDCTAEGRDRADYREVAAAFHGVPYVVTGDAASVLRGEQMPKGSVTRIDLTVPHSALASFAYVVTDHEMMVEGASRRLSPKDKASLVRRLRASDEQVTMRSSLLGRICVRAVPDSEFARLSRESHRASISVADDNGICEIFTVRVARRSSTPSDHVALFTTSFEIDLQRYLQHPTDSA